MLKDRMLKDKMLKDRQEILVLGELVLFFAAWGLGLAAAVDDYRVRTNASNANAGNNVAANSYHPGSYHPGGSSGTRFIDRFIDRYDEFE